jgi:hypothetical protein
MDRQIVYTGAIPQDIDVLLTNKNTMTALGMALQAIIGGSTWVDGLACTPTSPASLQVKVAQGSIYSTGNIDGTAYGSISSDTTHQIVKQGIVLGNTLFTITVPSTSGQSINYLIQAEYQDVDGGSTVLPYYNSSNPAVAYNGPNNTGVSQNTVRQGSCILSLKAGASATTGTQVTPTPDAGFTGLWVVTCANGATSITSGNISLYSGSSSATGSTSAWEGPFIPEKLNDKISIATGDLRYMPIGGGTSRTRLTNNTTFNVATTGNDSTGNGTSGTPWATIQHAVNVLMNSYDLAGFTAIISVAAGTYTGNTTITGPFTGGGLAVIQGVSSPVLSNTADTVSVFSGASVQLAGLTIQSSAGNGIHISQEGAVSFGTGMNFGACALAQILCEFDGLLNTIGNSYTISGGGTNHINLKNGGNFDCNSGSSATATITGSPTFSGAFINAQSCGTALIVNYTWSGSITGAAYSATLNGVIQGITGLPGSAGSTASGGEVV